MQSVCDGDMTAAFNPDPEVTKEALSQFDGRRPKKAKVRRRPRRTDIIKKNGVFRSSIDPAWLWPRKILCVEAARLRGVPVGMIALVLGVNRATCYRWLARFADDKAMLSDRRYSHGPRKKVHKASGVKAESELPVQEGPSCETDLQDAHEAGGGGHER